MEKVQVFFKKTKIKIAVVKLHKETSEYPHTSANLDSHCCFKVKLFCGNIRT